MKCNFVVGQKVVCVDVSEKLVAAANYPIVDNVYTIRKIVLDGDHIIVLLSEICNLHISSRIGEPGFGASRFRPLTERKTDISIFTKMLTDKQVETV